MYTYRLVVYIRRDGFVGNIMYHYSSLHIHLAKKIKNKNILNYTYVCN